MCVCGVRVYFCIYLRQKFKLPTLSSARCYSLSISGVQSQQGHHAAQGQSPRPSILRKRVAGGSGVEHSLSCSPATKRLIYDSPTSANSSLSSVTSTTSHISSHPVQILSMPSSSSIGLQRAVISSVQQLPSSFVERASCIRDAPDKDVNTSMYFNILRHP